MIHQPSFVPEEYVHRAISEVTSKKELVAATKLRLEEFN